MNAKQKKHDDAIQTEQNIIENAEKFLVVFKYSPSYTVEHINKTYDEAVKTAAKMNEELGNFGRRAAIYAVDAKNYRSIVRYLT